jgi:hypothetical protein
MYRLAICRPSNSISACARSHIGNVTLLVALLRDHLKVVGPQAYLESHVAGAEDLSLGVVHCQDGRVGLEELTQGHDGEW